MTQISAKYYKQKIFRFGSVTEIYNYEKPVYLGKKTKGRPKLSCNIEVKKINREKVSSRIRNNVRRLILNNFDESCRFITLTFKENITDLRIANREFKKFIQRLRYQYSDFKYLAVIEFQQRGAVHYHMLCDLDFIEVAEIEKIWENGFVWIKDLLKANNGKPVDNVGAYLVKYMNKNILDKRLMGKKAYFTSRNLVRPEIVYEDIGLDECFEKYDLSKNYMVYSNSFMSKENGMVLYYEFNKKRGNNLNLRN